MKNTSGLILMLSLLILLIGACKKDDPQPRVDEEGLTPDIRNLVPGYILQIMKDQGMPIYGGGNPPLIENTYLASPFVLLRSNRPGDTPGAVFSDYEVTFYDQREDDLSVMVNYISTDGIITESGSGLGSYVVGSDCRFSVFIELNSMYNNGSEVKSIHLISGEAASDGIENLHFANFVIDDYGDPTDVWIEVGEGRVFHDQDGFSPIKGLTRAWYTQLPPCPCTYAEAQRLKKTTCPAGEWLDCGEASQTYHYRAKHEIRWVPDESGAAGQQCTYDVTGKLITSGIAAGSPDLDSPDICGSGDILTGQGFPDLDHYLDDVRPWGKLPCWQYLRDWPANKGNACGIDNPVADIQHLQLMVGNMTCEEVTTLMITVDGAGSSFDQLKKFISGQANQTPANLKVELIRLSESLNCAQDIDEDYCRVLQTAIQNL